VDKNFFEFQFKNILAENILAILCLLAVVFLYCCKSE